MLPEIVQRIYGPEGVLLLAGGLLLCGLLGVLACCLVLRWLGVHHEAPER